MCSSAVASDEEGIDRAVLSMLVHDPAQGLWAVDEVVREIGDGSAVADSLARLYGAGLVHRLEGFVFATRPALRAEQLA